MCNQLFFCVADGIEFSVIPNKVGCLLTVHFPIQGHRHAYALSGTVPVLSEMFRLDDLYIASCLASKNVIVLSKISPCVVNYNPKSVM